MICLIDGDPLAYIAGWNVEVPEAKKNMDAIVQKICDSVFMEEHRIAVKGPNNFRDNVIDNYKGSRKSTPEQASMVRTLREYLIEAHGAIEAEGQEADDLLAQWSEECNQNGVDWVIASIDKDLLTIPGKHYNIRKGTIEEVGEDQADYLMNQQLLMGDRADDIPGLSGIGAKKSADILEGVPFGKRRSAVIGAYKSHYGDNWESELQLTGELIYIRRVKDEGFKI